MHVTSGRASLVSDKGGSGEPAALLLHAGVADRRSWRHLTPLLPGRWVSFDARGFGESTHESENGWSPVDDAVAVMDAHGLSRAVLVGSSLGGRTALDLALTHPDRVSGLVLIGPAVSGAPPADLEPAVEPLADALDGAEEAEDLSEVNRLEAHLWLDGPLQPEGRVGGDARELFLAMNGVALAAADPGEQRDDGAAWDRVSEITVPTLVMVGEHDLRHMRERAEHVAVGIPDSRFELLAGVAHLPHLEGDQRTLDAVVAFVRQVSG
jgi:pimeloyl-ACP methyl ester carboxylesterase